MIRNGIHSSAVIDIQGEASVPSTTILEPLAVIYVGAAAQLALGERNILYPHCSIRIERGWIRTGSDVSFGPGVAIYEPRAGLEIGSYTMIAGGTVICGTAHGSADLERPMRDQPSTAGKITIGEDVWIGMRAVIMPGVTIGDHAIIGAGSVVTTDIPPYSIAWGTPCRVQKQRTQDDSLD
jgi:acetyltransferase-like isoleucine patch superfamily enzyme